MRKPILRLTAIARDGAVQLSWMKSTPLFQTREVEEFSTFRVLRRNVDFVFGEDYDEYFLGLTPEGARVVFQGPLPAQGERRYRVTDDGVTVGRTYAYWIQTATSEPIGPVAVRPRDPEVWWSAERLDAELRQLVDLRPDLVRLESCGFTAHGRPIPSVVVGRGEHGVGLVGLLHAGESGPELIVPALKRLLTETPALLESVRVVALPSVNLDERQRHVDGVPWYLRTNAQGVDLNRNFPATWEQVELGYGLDSSDPTSATYRGPRPASAPETQAVLSVLEAEPVDVLLSYHCLASICSLPALTARAAQDDAPYARRCARLVEVLAGGLHPESPDAAQALRFGCSAGSLPAWCHERGVPALDLEAGIDADALARCRRDDTDRALLADYQQRHHAALAAVLRQVAEGRL